MADIASGAVDTALPGILIAIVGPSGAGKDTVLELARAALAETPGVTIARRIITRAPDSTEASVAVDPAEFDAMESAGAFLLTWRANGLAYGLPAALEEQLARGCTIVANISRGAVALARQKGLRVLAVEITADPARLASRLAARGRENAPAMRQRLDRNAAYAETFRADIVIANDEPPDFAAARLVEIIRVYACG